MIQTSSAKTWLFSPRIHSELYKTIFKVRVKLAELLITLFFFFPFVVYVVQLLLFQRHVSTDTSKFDTVNRGYFGQILTSNDRHKKLSSLSQLFKVYTI